MAKRQWTICQIQHIIDNYPTRPTAEVAAELGWTEKEINQAAWKIRLKKIIKSWWTPERDKKLLQLYRDNVLTYREIGEQMGKPWYSVYQRVRRLVKTG